MKKNTKAMSVFTHLLLGLGSGALVHLFTQDSAASGVAAGLGVSLGKDALQKIVSSFSSHGVNQVTDHLFEYLCDTESGPDTSLRQLFLNSFDIAMDNLREEYLSIGSANKYSEDTEYVRAFFNGLKANHEILLDSVETELLPESDLSNWLKGDSDQNRKWIFDRLGISGQEKAMYTRFREFLKGRLVPSIIKSFYTELQSSAPQNSPAWREFQRLELEAIRHHLSMLSEDNAEIKTLLNGLNVQNLRLEQLFGNLLQKIDVLGESAASIRRSTETVIQTLRLNELRLFSETEDWIKKKYGGSNTHSPGLEEFKDGRVCIPQAVKAEVEAHLENGEDVLLLGKPASGKTVFGLAIAMQWMRNRKTLGLYYDLANVSEAHNWVQLNTAKSDIDLVLDKMEGDLKDYRLLMILDNVHNAPGFSLELLDYAESKRVDGSMINSLCLSRQLVREITETNNLFSKDSLHEVYLNTNEEAFLCVAARLCVKACIPAVQDKTLASNWIKTCGGNLVAFAMAFDPTRPAALDEQSIHGIIRDKYLFLTQDQNGLAKFLELCTLNSLDIELNCNIIWNAVTVANVFPDFDRSRVIESVQRNSQIFCRLFHPSLASLCIKVQRKLMPDTDQISILLDVCSKDPDTLVKVLMRLNSRQYWKRDMIKLFVTELRKEPGMISKAFLQFPAFFLDLERIGIDPELYVRDLHDDQYRKLCDSLTRTNPVYVEPIMRFFRKTEISCRVDDILGQLLTNDVFRQRLRQTQPLHVVNFFRFVENTGQRGKVADLIKEILADGELSGNLNTRSFNSIVSFLAYLENSVFRNQAEALLMTLLDSPDFYRRLISSPPATVAQFFKYLSHSSRRAQSPKLINRVCADPEFRAKLLNAVGYQNLALLRFLNNGYKSLETELLAYIMGSETYIQSLTDTPLRNSIGFMEYARSKGFKEEIKALCIRIISRENIPRKLLEDDLDVVTKFFHLLISQKLHTEYINLFHTYLNSPTLIDKLVGQVFSIAYPMLEMIAAMGRTARLKEIIDRLTQSNEFCESLFDHECTSTMIPLVRLVSNSLKEDRQIYFDRIFACADRQRVLRHASGMRPEAAASMLAAIITNDILFPEEYEAMLKKAAGPRFQDVCPHPGYPKELLITWDAHTLINTLHPLINSFQRHLANRIIAGLMEDDALFRDWLARQTDIAKTQLKLYAETNNLSLLREHFNPEFISARRRRELDKIRQLSDQ